MKLLLRLMRWMPAAIDKVHLEWALREIDPMHPDAEYIVHRLSQLNGIGQVFAPRRSKA